LDAPLGPQYGAPHTACQTREKTKLNQHNSRISLLVGLFHRTCGENILFSFTSSTISSLMINEIARMPKTTGKKKVSQKNIELQLKSNLFKASN
jgi:hypothetical protein